MSGPFDDLTEAQRRQIREAHFEGKARQWHETGPEAPSPETRKLRAQLDAEALNQIAGELTGWTDDPGDDTDMLVAIVNIVRTTGRQVRDSREDEAQ